MDPDTLRNRTRRFVRLGLLIGAALSLLLLPWLITTGNRPLPRYGLSPLQIAGVYLLAGVIGGLSLAVLYPIKRWFLGAFALGVLTVAPVYLGFAFLLPGKTPLSAAWVIGAVLAFFAGGGLGAQLWSEQHTRTGPDSATIAVLWAIVVACQVLGWYLGLRWPGGPRAALGLGLVFLPPFVAVLATMARARRLG